MKKKKILHVVEAFGGGVFSFLVDLVNATTDEFEIVIAYKKREQTPENFEKYFNHDVRFIEVKNFTRSINIKQDIKAFIEIKKLIKELQPDIIHLHSSKAGFLGRMAIITCKMKVLYNPHGFSFLMQNCSTIKRVLYWSIEKIATLKQATIVACSHGECREALKLTNNVICINNGVNPKELDKLNICENINKKIRLCTSGRIGFQKNPKLFNEIAKEFPEYEFTWIGDGELREELSSPNINITGWKKRDEVLHLVNENDIFILTSLWEGLPISLLEAMYLKKICIVSNCVGNSDVIVNETNGFVCNTIEDFKKSILKVIATKDRCKKYTEKAYEDVQNEFNINKMIDKYKEIYLEG